MNLIHNTFQSHFHLTRTIDGAVAEILCFFFCLILIVAKETDARQSKIDQIRQERSVKWAGMGEMGSAIPSSSPFYSFPLLLLLLNSLLLLIYLCLPPLLCLKYWLRFSKKELRPHICIYITAIVLRVDLHICPHFS